MILAMTPEEQKKYEANCRKGEECFVAARNANKAFRSDRFVPTADEWSPCYFLDDKGKLVDCGSPMVKGSVFLSCQEGPSKFWPRPYFVRIMFWGNDDTGLERDEYFDDFSEALEKYDHLVRWLNHLGIACYWDLRKLGFNPA
jgi:hypothetical protein